MLGGGVLSWWGPLERTQPGGGQREAVWALCPAPHPACRTLSPEASCAALECTPCWAWPARGSGHTPPITGWPPPACALQPWASWGPTVTARVLHVSHEGWGDSAAGRRQSQGRAGAWTSPASFQDLPPPPPRCPTDTAEWPPGGLGGPDGGRKDGFLPAWIPTSTFQRWSSRAAAPNGRPTWPEQVGSGCPRPRTRPFRAPRGVVPWPSCQSRTQQGSGAPNPPGQRGVSRGSCRGVRTGRWW